MVHHKIGLKEINRIAIPAIMAGIAEPLISLGDLAIVGNIKEHSTEVLAAVGIAGSFLSTLIWILAQTKSAVSSIISRYLGANKLEEVSALVPQTIFLSFLLSFIVYGLTTILVWEIFQLYNASGLILDYSVSYFKIRAFGFPFTLVTFAIFGILRGLQNTLYAMFISIAGGIINLILDVIFVFGIDGVIPPMGIEGAALASLIAQFLMTLSAIWVLHKKTPFSMKLNFSIHPELKTLISISLNLVVRTISLNIALYLANRYAMGYGKTYIAAQTIALNIWLFSAFFIDGYANAGIAISGKLLGARDFAGLAQLGKDLVKYSLIVAFGVSLLFIVSYPWLGKIFTSEKEVLALFGNFFWMVILIQPFNAVAFTFDGIFKGLGEAKLLRNVLFLATFAGFIPTLLLCDWLGLKLYGIWIAFMVWMTIRSLFLLVKFRLFYSQRQN